MKKCLKVLLSLALVLALAGSAAGVAEAHYGHHSRRAKRVCPVAYTEARDTAPDSGYYGHHGGGHHGGRHHGGY